MISHAAADLILRQWAAAELAQFRRHWYPPCSAGYRDYEPPRDPEARQEREIVRLTRDDADAELAGWCLLTLKRVHRITLRRHYLDGRGVGRGARAAALDAFCRSWAEWGGVKEPRNSL